MREIRQSGSEGGEAGNLTGLPYPYQQKTERLLTILPFSAAAFSVRIPLRFSSMERGFRPRGPAE